ncbi:hypothetical protein J0676_18075 [Vibrio sp. Vb2880]|uniref:hypothetical protein n=1 Tax=Vibrio TaxID=662 RepID=UPI000674F560|nr:MULTISPECIES: hypothetical protein [Vibrio]MBO0215418.1 hypothetical protein [Vibrio sp. Vb2880]MBY7894591.1 hypothetical protein [Vibrio fluvialis]
MNITDFCQEISEIMQLDEVVDVNTVLSELDEWDSMSHLGVISMFDMEFSKSITNADLKQINSVFDLAKLAGIE